MPDLLESGKLQLSREEASTYRAAADPVHETCEMALDLGNPITVEDWIFQHPLVGCVASRGSAARLARSLGDLTKGKTKVGYGVAS